MSKIIVVSGMIGSGKSTFIQQYSKYLFDTYGIAPSLFLEPVESNRLLSMMYEDPKRWTYTSQVRFLVDKLNSLSEAMETSGLAIVERDYKELKIFIDTQLKVGSVTPIEYDSYMELYEACSRFLPQVTNYHIQLPLEVCLYRMQQRGRSFESLATNEYYKILHDAYDEVYKDHPENLIINDTLDIDTYRKLDITTFKGVYA